MKRIFLSWVAFALSCAPLPGGQKTHASDFGDERFQGSQDFDFRRLVTMEPQECLKSVGNLRTTFLYPERGWPERPEMVEAARYWAARNPRLAGYYQERVDSRPVLFENYSGRRFIESAADFPAEWAVRFLARLAMDDTRMTSDRIDFTNDAELEEWFMTSSRDHFPTDNARIAMVALGRMKLHGGGPPFVEDDRNIYGENYFVRSRANARTWWAANEHRIPEIVKATWGDHAVLNADIGFGPDNQPLVATGLAPPGTRPRKAGGIAADEAGIPAEASGGPAAVRWIPLVLASGLLALALAVVVTKRAKRLENP